jgi:hypothetical protein
MEKSKKGVTAEKQQPLFSTPVKGAYRQATFIMLSLIPKCKI